MRKLNGNQDKNAQMKAINQDSYIDFLNILGGHRNGNVRK